MIYKTANGDDLGIEERWKEIAMSEPDASRHSIRVTSRLTSIELDTLRMWERRYGFPKPERSEGGSRVYSDSDVESLKLIRRALELGHRPGEVVGKPREELMKLIAATSPKEVMELFRKEEEQYFEN